jgi:hypothetical protein
MRRVAVALALGLAGVSSSCGGDGEYTATSADAADLHVVQVWDESEGLYAEGALSYVRIETPGEEKLVEVELQPTESGHEASIRLDPGEYRLVSWQRPCDGNCDSLDPPTDRCAEEFALEPGNALTAAIKVRAADGCTIDFE